MRSMIETILGLAALLGLVWILFASWQASGNAEIKAGVKLEIWFNYVGDLIPGSDIRIAGIDVGTVLTTEFKPQQRQVLVTILVDPIYKIPIDSRTSIVADGLIGGAHVQITPGTSQTKLPRDGQIRNSIDALDMAGMVGKIIADGIAAQN